MSKIPNAILSVCFLFLWGRTTLLVTSSEAVNSDSDAFNIRHTSTGKCLVANGTASLGLALCNNNIQSQWKWGSGQRLFHVDTSLCLGLEVLTKTLSLFECNDKKSSGMLGWLCTEGGVYTTYQMGLTVTNGKVSARRDINDTWTRDGSQDNICQKPYRVIHTTNGNSAGAPCDFPFLFNGTWHHGCLPDEDVPERSWCATTSDYDRDGKMGHCLIPEEGCQSLFGHAKGGSCYQFLPSAAVTWQEALASCRSQGADLLSLSDPAELASIMDGLHSMPEKMWIGLHQLDMSQGWQWADGSALSYLRWESGMPPPILSLDESDCGVLNAKQNYESEACDKRLPYICKKSENASRISITESTVYKETECEQGWVPWNGWCYKVVKNQHRAFTDALEYCNKTEGGGSLATLHSLDSKELISTHFHEDGLLLDVWIGLIIRSGVFTWTDQAPVTFTFWDQNQPSQPTKDFSCVFYSAVSHGWRVGNCSSLNDFMCQKKGIVKESTANTTSKCPTEGGWRRHGDSCYQVNLKQVSFKDHCNITIRNKFEQAFINRLLVEQVSMETKYFWIGLQDIKNTGQYQWLDGAPVTYDNWGWREPGERGGGCVIMSTENPLGKWEVKNCTSFKAGTICKRDITSPPTPEPEVDVNASCPNGWISKPNIKYCYKVFHEERLSRKRSWEEAERFCQALGASLASFTHPEEMSALHYVIEDTINDNRFFWVGLNRRNPADRSWKWSDGRPVTMDTLHQGFHEDDAYNRNCAAFKTMKASMKHLFDFLFDISHPLLFYATPFHCDAKLEWVCQIPRGKTQKIPVWYNPSGHHETSIFVQGKEFWFVKEPMLTFEEAKLFCSVNGSKMAEPQSFTAATEIRHYIKELSSSLNQSWWADMNHPGRFFPITYTQMYLYHSRFLGRCTSISPERFFPEHENTCEQRLPFVCERHNTTLIERHPVEPHAGGLPCESNFLAFRDKCYTLIRKKMSYKNANEECISLKGTLVTISDQVEQDFVNTLLLKMPEVQKVWTGLKLKIDYPEWVDKSPVSFLNFNPLLHGMLRPLLVNTLIPDTMELCVFMINHPSSDMLGTWDYSSCLEEQHGAICQHYADKPEEPQVPSEPIHINNHTVLLLHQNLTWSEAHEQCRKRNMELASVADISLQSVLTVHVSRARTSMWIGLFSEDDGIHYRWTDQSHNVFSRWSSEATSGSCVYQDTDGFWKATQCEEVLEGAICHEPHEENVTTTTVTVKCPHKINGPNWIPFKSNCYTFQLLPSRWDALEKGTIRNTCKNFSQEAEILTVRNAEENEFIKQQLVPFQNLVQFVWLGLLQDDNDNQLKWYDGTTVQYSNWRAGRPDVQGEFMAGLNPDGVWELVSNKNYFSRFRQISIVACKLDYDTKDDYHMSFKNFERYGNLAYQVVSKRLTWFQALEECGHRGGYLASIHDAQHDAHVEMISKTDGFALWIGLSSHDSNGPSYEWSDGTIYDYKAAISDPQGGLSSNGGQFSCVFVTPKGDWVRADCNTLVDGAICYNTTITTSFQKTRLQVAPETNHCPPSYGKSQWVQNKDHCYAFHFDNYTVYSMEDAKSVCQNLGADVLTVNTKEENDFIVEHVSNDPFITSRVWLGMDLDTHGTPVAWLDGSALAFSNWKSGDPVSGGMPEAPCAVMMSADGGIWNRVSCKGTHSRVICKTERSRSSPVALVLLVVVLVALLGAIGFVLYKKNRAYFPSTVRYKRTYDEADSTTIITDAEA